MTPVFEIRERKRYERSRAFASHVLFFALGYLTYWACS